MSVAAEKCGRKVDRLRVRRSAASSIVLLFTISAIGILATPALAKDGQVTVRAAGTTNASVTVRLSELGDNDINNRTYELRSGPVTISGHSLLQVMNAADAESQEIDVATIPSITLDRPGGGRITISGDDLRDPAAFPDGPPVFYEDNGATVLVMPGSSVGSTGVRYRFTFAPAGVSVGSSASYTISLSASKTKVKVGQKVSFAAKVTGQEKGETLTYAWSFGDGKSLTTKAGKAGHTFGRKGGYSVILDVTGASGNGQSGILIEVGEARREADDDRKPDETNPPGNGGTGETADTGGAGYGYGTGGYGPGTGSGLPGGFTAPAEPAPSVPAPKPDPEPKERRPVDDGLTEVRGRLVDPVAGTTEVVPGDPQVVESADPVAPGSEQGGLGIPREAWAMAGVGLLLGLGGFAELRVFSRLY